MNQNLELEQEFTLEEMLESKNFNNENQDSELNLLNKLLEKLIAKNLTSKGITLTEVLKLKNTLLEQERKHAERMQKMSIERLKYQGIGIEEFTDTIQTLLKISIQFIPENQISDFTEAVNTGIKEKFNINIDE